MKKNIIVGLISLFGVLIWSCNQDRVVPSGDTNVAARLASDTTGFHCRDSLTKVAVVDLPAAITTYVTANYSGAVLTYAAKDDSGNFLAAITQNGQRKALLFNADGTFNREASLRGGKGRGHEQAGRGYKRDSLNRIAAADLPAAITGYVTANFAGATITLAAKDDQRGYFVMILLNNQRRTLLFGLDGTFSEEIVRGVKGNYTTVAVASLSTAITNYVTANYAGSTIVQAGTSPTGQFLVWVKTATGRPVALLFAADGTFVQVLRHRH